MIEKIMYDYLSAALNPIPVYTEIPSEPPGRFGTLEKTGGSRSNLLETATIAFQAWDTSLYGAADLCRTVCAVVDASIALDDISKAEYVSDYNYTDTGSKRYRYQAVYQITHY